MPVASAGIARSRRNHNLRSESTVARDYADPDDLAGFDLERDLGYPGEFPFTRGIQPTMYRGRLVDDAAVRRVWHRGRVEQALSVSAVAGRQRAERRLRPADANRLRLRSPAGRRRGRPRRRGDRLDRRHGDALRRHPARSRVDVDDDQRDRHHPAGAVRRGRQAAGRGAASTVGNGTERHPEGIHRARHLHLPAAASLRIVTDIFAFCAREVPQWNTISISGYHIREAGSTAVQEVAFTFANAIAYVQAAVDAGLDVNDFGQRLSFFFNAHNDFLEEIAKFRAARRLWARLMRDRFRRHQPAGAAAALPHADGRQHAHRAAARQQHRPRRAAGAGGGARRDAVAAHQRPRRGAGAADRRRRRASRSERSRSSRTNPASRIPSIPSPARTTSRR